MSLNKLHDHNVAHTDRYRQEVSKATQTASKSYPGLVLQPTNYMTSHEYVQLFGAQTLR